MSVGVVSSAHVPLFAPPVAKERISVQLASSDCPTSLPPQIPPPLPPLTASTTISATRTSVNLVNTQLFKTQCYH